MGFKSALCARVSARKNHGLRRKWVGLHGHHVTPKKVTVRQRVSRISRVQTTLKNVAESRPS